MQWAYVKFFGICLGERDVTYADYLHLPPRGPVPAPSLGDSSYDGGGGCRRLCPGTLCGRGLQVTGGQQYLTISTQLFSTIVYFI